MTFSDSGRGGPGVNRALHPGWNRHCAHAALLAEQIDYAPAAVPLLNVLHGEHRHLGPAQSATEKLRQHRSVAQSLLGGDIRSIQERLSLSNRKPVSYAHALGLGAFHARDAGGEFRR
jgi:hypothetical protein